MQCFDITQKRLKNLEVAETVADAQELNKLQAEWKALQEEAEAVLAKLKNQKFV